MKTLQNLVKMLFVLVTIVSTAQQGINYKAIVKDGGGNVVANQNVDIQFIIYEGPGETTNVYQETHSPNTDANGIVIVNIGEGTPDSGNYSTIDWGADDHYLNVQMDTGGGLTDLGTTQFMAVPYAIHSEEAGHAVTADNVSGLEALDEGNGIGWRLIGKNPNNFGNIGSDAVDLSYSSAASADYGATGSRSTAMGAFTQASGTYSTATGLSTIASGSYATASGYATEASGITATAIGDFTTASGNNSLAAGFNTKAQSFASVAFGKYNIGGGDPISWIETDPLFEIGNGTGGTPANVLTILKNGTITAPSFDIGEITDAKALITKEYFDVNAESSTGLESLNEGNGIGWRLIGRNPANYGNIGLGSVDFSYGSAASSTYGSTGSYAFASGYNTIASGNFSAAFGDTTIASGKYAVAMGFDTKALSIGSTALGYGTDAIHDYTTVVGLFNTTSAVNSLFEVGNGTTTIPHNAFTVLMNGNVGIDTHTPSTKLHITNGTDASVGGSDGFLVAGNISGLNLAIDENEIMARNNGAASSLFLQNDGGEVVTGGALNLNRFVASGVALKVNGDEALWYNGTYFSWGFGGTANFFDDNVGIGISNPDVALDVSGSIEYTGTITDVSDERLKENFKPIDNALSNISKVNTYTYTMKDDTDKLREYGVIAQELQKIFPEMVTEVDTENGYLGVSYVQLVPVLVKAIQEQQEIIDIEKLKNKNLEARIEKIERFIVKMSH